MNYTFHAHAFVAAARYKAGEPVHLISADLGYAPSSIRMYGSKFFPEFRRPNDDAMHPFKKKGAVRVASKISKSETRNQDMITAYRSGLTLQQIANMHNVTRERVRQILREADTPREVGGATLRGNRKIEKRKADIEARCYAKYGVSRSEWAEIGEKGRRAWREQKRSARARGIQFSMTLAEWWGVWKQSGKWEVRGRQKSQYVMSRIEDAGGYKVGNVYITSASNNCREARTHHTAKQGERGGVYFALPGYSRPWLAKYGRKQLGYHFTEEDARAARNTYLSTLQK